jgi:hypothetical protein
LQPFFITWVRLACAQLRLAASDAVGKRAAVALLNTGERPGQTEPNRSTDPKSGSKQSPDRIKATLMGAER